MTSEEEAYRIGRSRAIKQLWRTYCTLMKRASQAHYSSFRETLIMDAEHVKRRLDQLRAEA